MRGVSISQRFVQVYGYHDAGDGYGAKRKQDETLRMDDVFTRAQLAQLKRDVVGQYSEYIQEILVTEFNSFLADCIPYQDTSTWFTLLGIAAGNKKYRLLQFANGNKAQWGNPCVNSVPDWFNTRTPAKSSSLAAQLIYHWVNNNVDAMDIRSVGPTVTLAEVFQPGVCAAVLKKIERYGRPLKIVVETKGKTRDYGNTSAKSVSVSSVSLELLNTAGDLITIPLGMGDVIPTPNQTFEERTALTEKAWYFGQDGNWPMQH